MTIARLLGQIRGNNGEETGAAAADRAVLETAFTLGAAFDAQLRVLHVAMDPSQALPLLGEGMTGAMASRLTDDLAKSAAAAKATAESLFRELAQARAVPVLAEGEAAPVGRFSVMLEQVEGMEEEIAVARAKLSDLAILAHPTEEEGGSNPTAEAVLFGSGRPILLAPQPGMKDLPKRMAVAWNGSPEAARAVALALPILKRAEEVIVISGDSDSGPREAQPSALAGYLEAHGMKVATWRYQPEDWPVARSLLQETRKSGAGLLVMGAYGHSRVRQVLLGGATREAFKAGDIALFMAH
ncbi:MAG: universal stress protein [Rhodospirillales bacterium]